MLPKKVTRASLTDRSVYDNLRLRCLPGLLFCLDLKLVLLPRFVKGLHEEDANEHLLNLVQIYHDLPRRFLIFTGNDSALDCLLICLNLMQKAQAAVNFLLNQDIVHHLVHF